MTVVEITYKKHVSRRIIKAIVNTLDRHDSRLLKTHNPDIYTRKLSKPDRQQRAIVVRIYEPYYTTLTQQQVADIEHDVWSELSDYVDFTKIEVKIMTAPTDKSLTS